MHPTAQEKNLQTTRGHSSFSLSCCHLQALTVTLGPLVQIRRYPFAGEAVRSWRVAVGEQLGQTGFSLLMHSVAVGHSDQIHPIAIQRVA